MIPLFFGFTLNVVVSKMLLQKMTPQSVKSVIGEGGWWEWLRNLRGIFLFNGTEPSPAKMIQNN